MIGSNGNDQWSQGPPEKDAVLTINYVKAYFNTSDSARDEQYASRCPVPLPNTVMVNDVPQQVCAIPNAPGDPSPLFPPYGPSYFFTQHANQTPHQTVYSNTTDSTKTSAASGLRWISRTDALVTIAVSTIFSIVGHRFL
jgi:hypothetical protein